MKAGGAWNGQQVVPPTVMAKLRTSGDPKHNPLLWGDGGIERSYLSQFYCHAGITSSPFCGVGGKVGWACAGRVERTERKHGEYGTAHRSGARGRGAGP